MPEPRESSAASLWRVQWYPHSGRYLVSDGPLEVFGSCSIASFVEEGDAERFAVARNAWEHTAPRASEFGGCEPYPKPDRYDAGRAVFGSDPASLTDPKHAASVSERESLCVLTRQTVLALVCHSARGGDS